MQARDPLEMLIEELGDPEFQEALDKLVALVKALNKSGLLDVLLAMADEEVVSRLSSMLMTTGTMKLADNIEALTRAAGEVAQALSEPVEPVPPSELVYSLRDPEVLRGLARLLAVLRALGRT
ncbi:MAG: DUF1641 domain-containing protein [Desulfurococcales archaeon]|nr:DUF1641 domain-containing protein [Desulfurococcales archaeon]